jgi:phage terminase large subunit GpA-like protein
MGAPDRAAFSGLDGALLAGQAFAAGFAPPPRLSVTAWSDAHRRLPTKGAGEPGPWRTERTPFLGEVMDCLSTDHPAKRVVFIKSVQVGATECLNNVVGWFIDTQKAPMMVVQPTLDMAERWSKQRLASMIEDCPSLRAKIAPARARDSGNTTLLKEWPGGVMVVSGANSGASLRSMPARYILLDEVDAYPMALEGEGDPIKLAEARATTFPRRKVFLISTPTIESLSRIHKEWLASDQRRYHIACPHCGHQQHLVWDNLRWPDGKPELAIYHCAGCGAGIEEHHKTVMLLHVSMGGTAEWIATNPERATPGFHINALYTPLGLGLTWGELANEWDEARRDPERQKTFINLRLGEVVADPNEKLDADDLASRAGGYKIREVPPGCLAITVGVDVQKDRFAIVYLGHGRGGALWVLDYNELPADPTTDAGWQALDAVLTAPLVNSRGVSMKPLMTAIDSGYLTDNVLAYTRERQRRGVIAVKGASTYGKPIINRPSKLDVTVRGRTIKHGAEGWLVGGDTAKGFIFNRLTSDAKHAPHDRLVHFAEGLDASFYSQLTAEIWDPNKRKWIKVRPRNEALDTMVYAVAAAHHPSARIHLWKEPQWARLEAVLEPATGDLFAAPTAGNLQKNQPDAASERADHSEQARAMVPPPPTAHRRRRVVNNQPRRA